MPGAPTTGPDSPPGPDAVRAAVRTVVDSRSPERIAGHAAAIGAGPRQPLTGDPDHLATEDR